MYFVVRLQGHRLSFSPGVSGAPTECTHGTNAPSSPSTSSTALPIRVIVIKNEQGKDTLGFEYLDGPVTPKPEKLPERRARKKRSGPRKPKPPSGPKGGGNSGPPGRGSVPKVPLVKA